MDKKEKTLAEVFRPIDESFENEDVGEGTDEQRSTNLSMLGGCAKVQRYRPSADLIDRRGHFPLKLQSALASGPFTPAVFKPFIEVSKEIHRVNARETMETKVKQNVIDQTKSSATAMLIPTASKQVDHTKSSATAMLIPTAQRPIDNTKSSATAMLIPNSTEPVKLQQSTTKANRSTRTKTAMPIMI